MKTFDVQVLYESPIGLMRVHCVDGYIVKICFIDDSNVGSDFPVTSGHRSLVSGHLRECLKQLDLYFEGKLKRFSITSRINGTSFQQRVWHALSEIPFGTTISYKELAEMISHKNAVRAVGGANNRNNLSIVLPCHRVIGSDGSLTGYAGGLWRKEWLLKHERRYASSL